MIPINDDLSPILATHLPWLVEKSGEPRPEHCLFPWVKPVPSDPTRHATDITWGWDQWTNCEPVQASPAASTISGTLRD